MTYTAKIQKYVILIFLILVVWTLINSSDYSGMYYFLIPYLIFILAAIFMNFKLTIQEESLSFEILLFKFTVYKKEVNHKQIERMKLKRVGWARKCAIVKNKRGFDFRISNFYPSEVYNDLIDFADEHNIAISKTKDYLILERMN